MNQHFSFFAALLCLTSVTNAAAQFDSPLGPPTAPLENPITAEKAVLGKILYWEEQLSSDDTMACGTCHMPAAGFADPREGVHPGKDGIFQTSDDLYTSPGVIRSSASGDFKPDPTFGLQEQCTGRRTPDIFGALYSPTAFWDGRASGEFINPVTHAIGIKTGGSLESQIAGPPGSDGEMAREGRNWEMIAAKIASAKPLRLASNLPQDLMQALRQYPSYPLLFEQAFGTPEVSAERIIFAIATYERTLVPSDTPYFRWLRGEKTAMTANQIEGHNQFMRRAQCFSCHPPPIFTQPEFFNLGLRDWQEDPGRMNVTGLYADRGKFRVPSLLNAGLRPRYMHTGEHTTLWPGGVGQIYLDGGGPIVQDRDILLTTLKDVPGIEMDKIMDFVGNALTDARVRDELYPFDRPTLCSERMPVRESSQRRNLEPVETFSAHLLAKQPAFPGSADFRIGLDGGPVGAFARLVVSAAPSGSTAKGSSFLFHDPRLTQNYFLTTSDGGNGHGYATVQASIPNDSSLVGRRFSAQWFIEDFAKEEWLTTRASDFVIHE